jgi:signal transduction protein with GAF and PtsI domain
MKTEESFATELDAAIAHGETPESLLKKIMEHFDAQTGTVHRLDKSDGRLKLVAQIGIPEFLLSRIGDIPIGKGIAGAAARDQKAVNMCNLQTDTSGIARPDAKMTLMEGALAVPMLVDGQLRGTLGIGKKSAHEWSEAETRELEQIAAKLGAM